MSLIAFAFICAAPMAVALEVVPVTEIVTATPQTASSICVYNDAAFVLKWHLKNKDTGASSSETNSYPVWETKCMSATAAGSTVSAGAALTPVVQAVWGKEVTASSPVLYDPINATQVTYICKGTTLDYDCKQGPAPATAKNVTEAALKFLLGFTEGLGTEIGFADCMKDIETAYHDITTIVDFFESGINHKTVSAVVKAFELIGELIKDIAKAIGVCVKDAKSFIAKMKDVAAALTGNIWSIIKIVVDEAVHIYHDRAELTADAKTTVTSWRGGDYKSSGHAVGDIVGIIIAGL